MTPGVLDAKDSLMPAALLPAPDCALRFER
jgi:hypothetical protein